MQSEIINIPIALVKQATKSKDAKDLLAMAMCVKGIFVSSNVTHCTIRKITSLLHISPNKAQRLLGLARMSGLFNFDEKTKTLHAVSFHSPITKISRSGLMYRSDFCFKLKRSDLFEEVEINNGGTITKKTAITMRKASRMIEHIAFLNAIQARFRCNRLTQLVSRCNDAYIFGSSMSRLGNTIGTSRTTARRRVDEYVSQGHLVVLDSYNRMVVPVASDEYIEELRENGELDELDGYYFFKCPYNNMVYVVVPTGMLIGNIEGLLSYFKNIIWNHQSRVGQRRHKHYVKRDHGHRRKYWKSGYSARPVHPKHKYELQILPAA